MLEALARALQLDDAERAHLFDLARAAEPGAPRRPRARHSRRVRPVVQQILDSDRRARPTCATRASTTSPPTRSAGRCTRRCSTAASSRPTRARFTFLIPPPPTSSPTGTRVANEPSRTCAPRPAATRTTAQLSDLIGELSTRSDEFRVRWAAHNVRFHRTGTKRIHHPVVGELELSYEALELTRRRRPHASPSSPPSPAPRRSRRSTCSPAGPRRPRPPARRRSTHGTSPPGTHRRPGLKAVPRHDDVRRLGQHRPRRLDPHHPPRPRRRHQLHRHRRRLLPPASPRRSSARRSRAGATTSCWRPSSSCRWARIPTAAAARGAGSSRRSRTRCAGSGPTGSTSTRSTVPTRRPIVDETLGALTDLVQQGKVRSIGSSSYSGSRDRRGAVGRARPPAGALPHRAAALLAAHAPHRARRPAHRPAARHGHPHLQPARRRLALGELDGRQHADLAGPAAAGRPLRHVAAREPAQARSRRAARRGSPTTRACR